MNILDKLKLLEYYYEPINDKQFLYIKDKNVYLCEGNNYITTTLEEVVKVFDEKKAYIVDQSLTIQAIHYKRNVEKIMKTIGIDWNDLTSMEDEFKKSIAGVVGQYIIKKPRLQLVEEE